MSPEVTVQIRGLIDRIADNEHWTMHVEGVRRTARSLVEAKTQLAQMAWLLRESRTELKRMMDTVIEQAKDEKKAADKPAIVKPTKPPKKGKKR